MNSSCARIADRKVVRQHAARPRLSLHSRLPGAMTVVQLASLALVESRFFPHPSVTSGRRPERHDLHLTIPARELLVLYLVRN